MPEYALYVESGPRRRKTMVHVLDLLGCIAQGATTEEALEATPEAIRAYLRFLRRHGAAVEPEAAVTTTIAAHIMEGSWIGQGDPAVGFPPDFETLRAEDLAVYLRRLDWLWSDLLESVRGLSRQQLVAQPEGGGRSIDAILKHLAGAHGTYLRYLVGKVDDLPAASRAVEEADPESVTLALAHLGRVCVVRLEALTEAERSRAVPHGQLTWTARRALRRMLEHAWEHLSEISRRLEKAGGEAFQRDGTSSVAG